MQKLEINRMKQSLFGALLAAALAVTLAACGGGGTTPVTGVEIRPLSAEFSTRKAVNYSPFRTARDSSGLAAEVIPPENILQDLRLLEAADFGLIRVFSSQDKVARQTLEVIRDNDLDIRVQLGIFVGGDTYADAAQRAVIYANDAAEIARGVALANEFSDLVVAVSVGNETQVDFSGVRTNVDTLARYLEEVRRQVSQPVTTDDNWFAWSQMPAAIVDKVDFVSIHTYPVLDTIFDPELYDWRQRDAEPDVRAVAMADASLDEAKRQYQVVRDFLDGKGLRSMPVTIGETGWNVLDPRLTFRAHPANQKLYLERLDAWAADGRAGNGPLSVMYFEAFDEPWKQLDDGWGLFNVQRQARYAIQSLGTCGVTWACETGTTSDAQALYFIPAVPGTEVAENRYTIYSDAPLGPSEVRPSGLRFDAFDGDSVFAPEVTGTAAPGDGNASIALTPQPKNYGWGFLNQGTESANLSQFAGGSVNFSVRTTYPGRIEVGISTDTADRNIEEAYLQIGNGEYGYCNTGEWCQVSIPLSAFLAVNPDLDLSLVLLRFIIADRYEFTGKPLNSNITTPLALDAIFWEK